MSTTVRMGRTAQTALLKTRERPVATGVHRPANLSEMSLALRISGNAYPNAFSGLGGRIRLRRDCATTPNADTLPEYRFV